MKIAFWGSSLVSAYWNGAATYYRGILRALANRGCEIHFFEPDAYDRQQHRDMADPEWARIVVYDPADATALHRNLLWSESCPVVVKASGVGVLDQFLEAKVAAMPDAVCKIFWDVDAPATLERLHNNPQDNFHACLPNYNLVLTYGGGKRVTEQYGQLGARDCVAIYNAFDPDVHFPADPAPRFASDLSFLGNRLPDREARVEEFFLRAASLAPGQSFLLGGSGWADKPMPANVRYAGHVYTADHNRFNCSSKTVLNVSRESMARYGYSPATRVFEAAGAGACLITDYWEGIESFLQPGREVIVAHSGEDVARTVRELPPERALAMGRAARLRVLADHTYERRGDLLQDVLNQAVPRTSSSRGLEIEV